MLPGRDHASPDAPQPWLLADSLTGGRRTLVPAAAIWLGTQRDPAICTPTTGTSNGLAAASDARTATARALLELCERDAVLAWWWGGASATTLDLLPGDIHRLCELVGDRTDAQGVVIHRVPGVPVVALVARSRSRFALGCGAAGDLPTATAHALREAAAGLVHETGSSTEVLSLPGSVTSLAARYSFYFPSGRIWDAFRTRLPSRMTGIKLASTGSRPSAVTPESLGRALRDAGHRAFRVIVSSSNEFSVARVVSDTLIPLNAHPCEQAVSAVGLIGSRRLADDRLHPHPVY